MAAPTGGPISPGVGTETFDWSATNNTSGSETVGSLTASIVSDANGGVYNTTTSSFVDTCLASWFTLNLPIGTSVLPGSMGAGVVFSPETNPNVGPITLTMPANASVDQSACEGVAVELSLTATGTAP